MSRPFFITASGDTAEAHFEASLREGIELSVVSPLTGIHGDLERHADANGRVYAWGAMPGEQNVPRWEAMRPGDVGLVYRAGRIVLCGRVYAKARSRRVAAAIWGMDDGQTWEYMYFLDPPLEVDLPIADVAEALGYKPNWFPRGFAFLSEDAEADLLAEYGSITGLLEELVPDPAVTEAVGEPPEVVSSAVDGKSGAGYPQSPAERSAIEERAMTVATEFYESRGWSVTDVSTKKPYDIVCVKSGKKEELRVEVKGSKSSGTEVELTAGEVANAEVHPHVALFIVSAIQIRGSGGSVTATGGKSKVIDPWNVEQDDLTPTRYRYAVPGG